MIPEKIRIGAYTVKVVYTMNLMTDDEHCGDYNDRTKTIRLDPDMAPEMIYGVFIHEIIEAVKDIYSIDCLKEDHHAINLLGEAWHQVLRDNGKEILPE